MFDFDGEKLNTEMELISFVSRLLVRREADISRGTVILFVREIVFTFLSIMAYFKRKEFACSGSKFYGLRGENS